MLLFDCLLFGCFVAAAAAAAHSLIRRSPTMDAIDGISKGQRATYKNAATELFSRMDGDIKDAFYTCYKTYGKVSTKKLLVCFQNPTTVRAIDEVVGMMADGLNPFELPSKPPTFFSFDDSVEERGVAWLNEMPIGPGVSPCVNNTCKHFLNGERTDEVSSLDFFRALCGIASEPRSIIESKEIDVAKLVQKVVERARWNRID